MKFKEVRFWLVAIVSGLLMALSSAPFDQWYLSYIAFVPLFLVTQQASPHKQGLAFALACTVIAANWWHSSIIFSSLFFILILFILGFAFYLWALLSARFRTEQSHPLCTLFMPAIIWVGIERILSSELVGIPCNIGITQTSQTVFIQSANLFGIYTTSFLLILSNTAIALLISMFLNKTIKINIQQHKKNIVALSSVAFIMFANLSYGYNQTQQINDVSNGINVVLIQPIISSNLYANSWRNPESRSFVRNTLNELTNAALKEKPDLLVWPEGGNGFFNMRIKKLRDKLYNLARDNNTDLLISSNDLDTEGRKYNSIFSISKQGKLLDRYNKVMLIPGAEDSYTAGTEFHPISSSFGKIGPSICYESNFPSPLRKQASKGAELLVVSTSDAPFKKTSLTINHTRTAIFRAIENNRWVVHASNTGPSVIVSPTGIVTAETQFYQRGYISGKVQYIKEKSFFTTFGYLIPMLLSAIVLLLILIAVSSLIKIRKEFKKMIMKFNGKEISKRFITRYVPLTFLHGVFLSILILSSIVIVSRMVPDSKTSTVADVVNDFFEPLDKRAPDKVADNFLQASSNTCGPAVLAYLFSFYGHEVLESNLVPSMVISQKGTTMLELKNTAIKHGFKAKGVRESYGALMNEPLPVIAYINDSHYVVVNKITSSTVYLFDPLLGHVKVARDVFESEWKGYILLVNMKEIDKTI
ncbi:hypothetical protein MNBD_GAMMA22-2472 [hydrothermal vent metagenome]|uniref:Apolipoprotein N-acyltransferase / Copper homeostasis protein CutE n=1 Tax=hydrothermal vent metagenome TaxID=652676 RepID=A0A3B1AWK7_9ZZZZ